MPLLAIIVPCYNEAARLDVNVFVDFANSIENIHFYFVNDGSTDETLSKLNYIQKSTSQSTILNLKKNVGKGEAVRQGLLAAFQKPYSYLGYFDADLSTPLQQFYYLFKMAQKKNADIMIGARIKKIDTNIKRSFIRHIIGRIIATAIDSQFKLGVYDTQCGAKIFKSNNLYFIIQEPFITNWLFDVEILLRYKEKLTNLKCFEMPLKEWVNKKDSKINVLTFPYVAKDLMYLFFKYKRRNEVC